MTLAARVWGWRLRAATPGHTAVIWLVRIRAASVPCSGWYCHLSPAKRRLTSEVNQAASLSLRAWHLETNVAEAASHEQHAACWRNPTRCSFVPEPECARVAFHRHRALLARHHFVSDGVAN